jgi:hypothetical protein
MRNYSSRETRKISHCGNNTRRERSCLRCNYLQELAVVTVAERTDNSDLSS